MAKLTLDQSVLDNIKRGDKVRLVYTDDEVIAMLELLGFAFETAKYVLDIEVAKGSPEGTEKIRRYMRNAEKLLLRTYANIAMHGAPEDGELH